MGIREELDGMNAPPGGGSSDLKTVDLKPGETLVGQVTGYHVAKTRYGEKPIVHLRPEGKTEDVGVWISAVVLRDLFQDAQPVPGDSIGIKRFEDHTNPNYKQYHLAIERGNVPFYGTLPVFAVQENDERLPPSQPALLANGTNDERAPDRTPPADDIPPPTDDDIPF